MWFNINASKGLSTDRFNFFFAGFPALVVGHGVDGAGSGDTAQRMRSERYQFCGGLCGKCARNQDGSAERPAKPLKPADEIDGGTDRGEVQPVRRSDIAPQNLAKVQRGTER